MDNKINVPGAHELARARTRRDFFKTLAVAGAGATAASALFAGKASAKTDDVDIANFALTLEYLEAEFYALALDSGTLSGDALGVVQNLESHESQHVDALIGLLESVGATPVEKPTFTFPADATSSEASILSTAATLEPVGVGGSIGRSLRDLGALDRRSRHQTQDPLHRRLLGGCPARHRTRAAGRRARSGPGNAGGGRREGEERRQPARVAPPVDEAHGFT